MFIRIERQTSILKTAKKDIFLMKPKHQNHLSQGGECFMVPNYEKKGDYYVNPCLTQLNDELQF